MKARNEATRQVKMKLHPRRYPNMSSKMAAIVGCVLNEAYTEPAIAHLYTTSDGCLLAQLQGDIGANEFLGTASELRQNWDRLLAVAGLSEKETQVANEYYRQATQGG